MKVDVEVKHCLDCPFVRLRYQNSIDRNVHIWLTCDHPERTKYNMVEYDIELARDLLLIIKDYESGNLIEGEKCPLAHDSEIPDETA